MGYMSATGLILRVARDAILLLAGGAVAQFVWPAMLSSFPYLEKPALHILGLSIPCRWRSWTLITSRSCSPGLGKSILLLFLSDFFLERIDIAGGNPFASHT